MDTFRSAYGDARKSSDKKREHAIFKAQMVHLTDPEPFNGEKFLNLVEEMKSASGLSGMKEHLPWVSNNPALSEFKQQQDILHALTPAERANTFSIRIAAKKRVARAVGVDLLQVEALLAQVANLVTVQKFLKGWVAKGGQLPQSSDELQRLVMQEGSGGRMRKGGHPPNPGVKRRGGRMS